MLNKKVTENTLIVKNLTLRFTLLVTPPPPQKKKKPTLNRCRIPKSHFTFFSFPHIKAHALYKSYTGPAALICKKSFNHNIIL